MAKKTLSFSLSIYKKDAIEEAMRAYGSHARFSVEEQQHALIIEIIPLFPAHAEQIIDSFCNHALFETIVQHRKEQGGLL